jgi:peptidoglycan/xylan/chitin deacetylase (PgdA/CDA1 family)
MGMIKNIIRKADPLTKRFHSYREPIFPYYHTVSNKDLPHIKGIYNYKNEKDFTRDLEFLLKKYKILEPSELLNCVQNDIKIPSNSFLLSFDDGLSEVYDTILPILNKKGVPAIFFINNRYIDNSTLFYKHKISIIVQSLSVNECEKNIRKLFHNSTGSKLDLVQKIKSINYNETKKLNELLDAIGINEQEYLKSKQPYLTFSELNKIIDQGHYLGGHTVNHFPLDQLNIEKQIEEILDSVIWLRENFNLDYELFSFPFSDVFASETLFDQLFSAIPSLVLMGNQGMKKDISNNIIQRFSLEKEAQSSVGVRMNIAYKKYLTLTGKVKIKRKTL